MQQLHLLVLWHRIGPYHAARLGAAGRRGRLTAIEFCRNDRTYQWDHVHGAEGFERITLFSDEIDEKPLSTVRRRVNQALSEARPDVVALPGWGSRTALIALEWCLNAQVPTIMMTDSAWRDVPRKGWIEAIKRQVVALSSSGLASGTDSSRYLEMLGIPRERIFLGYDVVDNDHFASGAEAARERSSPLRGRLGLPERFFLATARFVHKKNLPYLVQAYARYASRGGGHPWHLVILGDGPLKEVISALIHKLDLDRKVIMPGFAQYRDLPIYYGLAQAFVLPSTTEQWGLVVNEAMAAGLPVLVSNRCGCAADLVHAGKNGYTFHPHDVDELAALMLRISSEGCDRKAMGEASQRVISSWSPDAFARNLWRAAGVARARPLVRPGIVSRLLLKLLVQRCHKSGEA